jgi:hypothetical protein
MWETISNPPPVSSMLDLQALPQTETPLEVQPQRLRDALCDGHYGVEIGILVPFSAQTNPIDSDFVNI